METARFATASGLSVEALRHYDELGAIEISPPTDRGWKPRCFVVDDPDGNRIQLSRKADDLLSARPVGSPGWRTTCRNGYGSSDVR